MTEKRSRPAAIRTTSLNASTNPTLAGKTDTGRGKQLLEQLRRKNALAPSTPEPILYPKGSWGPPEAKALAAPREWVLGE